MINASGESVRLLGKNDLCSPKTAAKVSSVPAVIHRRRLRPLIEALHQWLPARLDQALDDLERYIHGVNVSINSGPTASSARVS